MEYEWNKQAKFLRFLLIEYQWKMNGKVHGKYDSSHKMIFFSWEFMESEWNSNGVLLNPIMSHTNYQLKYSIYSVPNNEPRLGMVYDGV